MAVAQVPEVVEGLKQATSAVGQALAAAEDPRRATSVVEAAGIMPWVAPGEEEVSELPVTGARRAGALHRAAREASAVPVHHGAVVGGPEVVEVPVVAAVAGVEDVGKQEREISPRETAPRMGN
jgi:hypothetical protein